MDKQKNPQQEVDQERKKENVSVLEKIRRRTGLLVGIVGLALVIFILESLLGSGASIFGGSEMSSAGSINGKKIDRNEFAMRFENYLNNYRQRNQGREVDDATKGQAIESIWQQYIVELVMKPEFKEIGISVGEDELYESVVVNPVETIIQNLTDPNTGKVNEQFSRPDGSLDPIKWRQAVQNVTGDNEMAVRSMEDQVRDARYFEKFRTLVSKGLYVTKAEAKNNFKNQSQQISIAFVHKPFMSVSDSAVKVTDSDIQKYYKDHTYLYTQTESVRKVEYVSFDVLPSPEDLALVQADAQRAAAEFKGKSVSEDSTFLAQESENGNIAIQKFNKKSMIIRDSSVFTSAPGTVFGPYNEGAYFKIYKLQAINSIADSARVRHILIGTMDPQTQQPTRSKTDAKRMADSLLTLIKERKVGFDTLVKTVSDDKGSIEKGGDYGWWGEDAQWVEPFKDAGLTGVKGNISVVETAFGYHIIEVMDISKTRHNSYTVAQIFKLIAPSDETNQRIFGTASQFAGENNTGDLFDKAVTSQKLTKRMADNLKEGDYQVPGLTGAKELVKWAYTAEKGDVNIFSLNDRHVVAKLSGIKNKGTLPLEEVKDQVTAKAIEQKKAELFTEEFKKAGDGKTVESIASKLGLEVKRSENVVPMASNIDGIGPDNIMVGTACGTKQGSTSRITTGNNGVFVLNVISSKTGTEPTDYTQQRQEMERMIGGRTDYEAFNALRDLSDIEFHKSRIDF